MAKVLEMGEVKPDVAIHRCHHCNSLVEFTRMDMNTHPYGDHWANCPVCNAIIGAKKLVFKRPA